MLNFKNEYRLCFGRLAFKIVINIQKRRENKNINKRKRTYLSKIFLTKSIQFSLNVYKLAFFKHSKKILKYFDSCSAIYRHMKF